MPFMQEVEIVRAATPAEIDGDQMLYGRKGYLPYWVVRTVASGILSVANEIDVWPAWVYAQTKGDTHE